MMLFKSLETVGYLFYVVSPKRTAFEKVEDVPDYHVQVVPVFFVAILIQHLISAKTKRSVPRENDVFGSVAQGLMSELVRILIESAKVAAYMYVYSNWRILTLPWDSIWTWVITFLAVDFLYYLGHRAGHEINILWEAHQVHHSSEDYNLSTALRQSVFQSAVLATSYLPLALVIPPAIILVHLQFNLLFQFWIHTELIKSLGPLEYLLNTASHHRVHHGRNRYCIDKNYAGVLIIWDRMFGTFEPEGEEVVYGLTHPINTFETIYIQFHHFVHIWRTFWSTEGWKNKLSVIFKGPGWAPGKPRLGNIEDIPDVKTPAERYDPPLPFWCKWYALYHLIILAVGFVELAEGKKVFPLEIFYGGIIYEVFSFSVLGIFLDTRPYAALLELIRCTTYIAVDYYFIPWTRISAIPPVFQMAFLTVIRASHLVSGIMWLSQCVKSVSITWHSDSKKLD